MKMLFLALVGAYAVYAAVMIWLHPRFIYPFQPDDAVLDGFDRVELVGADGTPIFVQEHKGSGPMVLYLMGNAGALAFFETAFTPHIKADRHIVALEYRGGAGRPGVQSETVLKSDALIAGDYALSKGKSTVVQGYSLGSGLATHVASQRPVDGVVLVAPYDRLCRLLAKRSYLPACLLPFVQKWKSIDAARKIEVPIHVLHGSEDALIPPAFSAGFTSIPTATRRLIEGAGHTDIGSFDGYQAGLAEAFVHVEAESKR